MKGPRRIVDLDGVPLVQWRIDERAVVLWKNRLWEKEKVGCCLCVENDGPEFVTLSHSEDGKPDVFHCMKHGELVEVPFTMKKIYTITIGDVIREGEENVCDTMLFPSDMTLSARSELIGRLLDEAQEDSVSEGVT